MPPLVSIITPSYHQAQYLEQTICSVLGQDYPNIQYLIADGGSTDGSVEMIQRYEARLAWWVSEPDQGQAEAINKGMARADGEIVAWLNSDDLYAPGAVRKAVDALMQNPKAGLVYGRAVSINPKGRPLNDLAFGRWGLNDLAAFKILTQPAVFVRRAAWEEAGGLDMSYHLLLDHHLWLRIAARHPILGVPEVWAFARHHPAAKNVAQAEKFGREAWRIVAWMKSDPALSAVYTQHSREIRASALRFSARYLLEGGKAGLALKGYLQALFTHPLSALVEWHRILFAGLSLLGLGGLGRAYYAMKHRELPHSMRGVEDVAKLFDLDAKPQ